MRLKFKVLLVCVCVAVACSDPEVAGPQVQFLDQPGEVKLESTTSSEPLPAYMTEEERERKEDGWDPRDGYPDVYGVTPPPNDVAGLPGEFEDVAELYVGWADSAWSLDDFFVKLVREAAEHVPVTVFVASEREANSVAAEIETDGLAQDRVTFLVTELDSIWIRDYGPLVVRTTEGGKRFIDARYYWGRWADDRLPTVFASSRGVPVSRPALDMEGGNFQSDGQGRCITTEYLVEQNAGRGYDEQEVRNILQLFYGCRQTVILPRMEGEGTGHVDMFATISGPAEVVVGTYDPADDEVNAERLDRAATMLTSEGFAVRRVPMPSNSGQSVFRSYTNGLAIDGAVLVPVYREDRRYEAQALEVFAAAYPGREIVPIESDEIIQWAGAIHCVTMTMAE